MAICDDEPLIIPPKEIDEKQLSLVISNENDDPIRRSSLHDSMLYILANNPQKLKMTQEQRELNHMYAFTSITPKSNLPSRAASISNFDNNKSNNNYTDEQSGSHKRRFSK